MADPLLPTDVEAYLERLVPARPPELASMEAYARAHRFPIIGPVAGYFCYALARMIGARRVFELGSGFGYSTAWFARAVTENGGGTVFHVVWDEDLSQRARRDLTAMGYGNTVQYRVGEAVQVLRETEGTFDLIFNDIDKEAYAGALPVIAGKVRSGGLLIMDNALWHGRVADPEDHSPSTESIREATRMISEDPNWIGVVAPVRDGLLIAYRR
jgi:predicted O-methyltransferase YrrM